MDEDAWFTNSCDAGMHAHELEHTRTMDLVSFNGSLTNFRIRINEFGHWEVGK